MTRNAAMGGRAWTGLSHGDERVKKAFALWANSVYGMVTYWATGQRTQHGRSTMQVNAIRNVKCPDFAALGDAALDRAAADFDSIVGESWGSVDMKPACMAFDDRVRSRISAAVSNMLLAPGYNHEELARMWCAEPSVMKMPSGNKRRGGGNEEC